MTDKKSKSGIPAEILAGTDRLGGNSGGTPVKKPGHSDGYDLLEYYREVYDPETYQEFCELSLSWNMTRNAATKDRILDQKGYKPTGAERKEVDQHYRRVLLEHEYRNFLMARLKSNRLEAKGIPDGSPPNEPRITINPALWDVLELDMVMSSASGAGRTIRSIRILNARPEPGYEKTENRPYVARKALKEWMVDWFKKRDKLDENRGCELCEDEAPDAFPEHKVPRDLVRAIWPEVRGPRLKTGPKKGSKRPPRVVSGDTNDGSDG